MARGKELRLFLIDGVPSGRIAIELSNWVGKGIKIPRNRLENSKDRPELSKAGVYFLFGRDDITGEYNKVYIGESEEVFNRALGHHREKDFWSEILFVVSKDENLNKAHIKYLEHRLYQMALSANRYEVLNGNIPTQSSISEAEKAVMEEFSENIGVLVGTLGYRVFDSLVVKQEKISILDENFRTASIPNPSKDVTGYSIENSKVRAFAVENDEGFIVLDGSEIVDPPSEHFGKHNYCKLRDKLISDGSIVRDGIKLIFKKNVLFSSPSAAAAVVLGRSANGPLEWKPNS
jgi:hypothetical protein